MKKHPSPTRAADVQHPIAAKQVRKASEPLDLSPERISQGASTTTELLTQILEREQRLYRHWGINE